MRDEAIVRVIGMLGLHKPHIEAPHDRVVHALGVFGYSWDDVEQICHEWTLIGIYGPEGLSVRDTESLQLHWIVMAEYVQARGYVEALEDLL